MDDTGTVFTRIPQLLDFLGLDRKSAPYRLCDDSPFGLLVPREFASLMRKGDWYDPLLLQILPRAEELEWREGFVSDAVGDKRSVVAPRLLRKYASRALLLVSGGCPVHCRYCFRRAFPFTRSVCPDFANELNYIGQHPELSEVILSGGEPLMLPADQLGALLRGIGQIPSVTTIRIHTRLPIVYPSRLDSRMFEALTAVARARNLVVVVHANCAEELQQAAKCALDRLRAAGALLLNQSVLLRGVNDSVEALARLSARLIDCGVLPFYLHQLDRAEGTWHFETSPSEGLRLIEQLRLRVAGYAVPRYVKEVAGAGSKVDVSRA